MLAANHLCSGVTKGWVHDTPGRQLRVSPLYFFLKNLATFLVASSAVPWRPFFAHRFIAFYCFHSGYLGCHPPRGCHPTPLPVRPRFSTILCKFAHKSFFPSDVTPLEGVTRGGPPRVSPPGGCHPGRSTPLASPLVTPLAHCTDARVL